MHCGSTYAPKGALWFPDDPCRSFIRIASNLEFGLGIDIARSLLILVHVGALGGAPRSAYKVNIGFHPGRRFYPFHFKFRIYM